jgi:hypothetical protein
MRTAFILGTAGETLVADPSYSMNSNQRVHIPHWENENWGWTAVAVILAFLLAAIVIYSPPDLADRSTSASLGDHETTGRGSAPQR